MSRRGIFGNISENYYKDLIWKHSLEGHQHVGCVVWENWNLKCFNVLSVRVVTAPVLLTVVVLTSRAQLEVPEEKVAAVLTLLTAVVQTN